MLFHLFFEIKGFFGPLRVFRYVSFRIIAAILTAMLISFLLSPWFIRKLSSKQIGQNIRDDGPQSHLKKAGTPTMGGSLVLFAIVVPTLLWVDLTNHYIWAALSITVIYGGVGFVDDYLKLKGGSHKGLRGKYRLLIEAIIALIVIGTFLMNKSLLFSTQLFVPFLRPDLFPLVIPPLIYLVLGIIVVVGTANSVNLTDGLDGLAIGPILVAASTFLILAYITGTTLQYHEVVNGTLFLRKFDFAYYLNIPSIPGVQELAIFCASIIGAGVGFLWFNTYPAQYFMGDVGSLSLGGALGILAVITKNELLMVIIGGIFVAEALSVIIQTSSYKLTGKRVFKMAPLHHHYELKGWAEPKIIVRFWVISIMLALLALASLKLR